MGRTDTGTFYTVREVLIRDVITSQPLLFIPTSVCYNVIVSAVPLVVQLVAFTQGRLGVRGEDRTKQANLGIPREEVLRDRSSR